jgi:hypothetical protein
LKVLRIGHCASTFMIAPPLVPINRCAGRHLSETSGPARLAARPRRELPRRRRTAEKREEFTARTSLMPSCGLGVGRASVNDRSTTAWRPSAKIQSTNHRHNYSRLLILSAGAGCVIMRYAMGHFVETGEPVAVMGGGAQSAVAKAGGASQPVLYVEFRKDGVPVDPGPCKRSQKVRR